MRKFYEFFSDNFRNPSMNSYEFFDGRGVSQPFDYGADPDPEIVNGIFYLRGIGPIVRILRDQLARRRVEVCWCV